MLRGDTDGDAAEWTPGKGSRGGNVSEFSERRLANRTDRPNRTLSAARDTTNLADLLERVLDKGIVIAGDITLAVGGVDLLTLKIRLLIASVDKAQEIGINWWQSDPFLSSHAKQVEEERDLLLKRLERLEARLGGSSNGTAQLESGQSTGTAEPQLEEAQREADAPEPRPEPSVGDNA